MAFFNLTHLGPQDPFRVASTAHQSRVNQENTEVSNSSRQSEVQGDLMTKQAHSSSSDATRDQPESSGTHQHKQTSHVAVYSTNKTTTRHGGSHTKYTELLRKHQRDSKGPMDHYEYPLTTSQMYGWWMKGGNPQKAKWARNEKHVHVNSEMTRFVDEMSLTNKEFSLY